MWALCGENTEHRYGALDGAHTPRSLRFIHRLRAPICHRISLRGPAGERYLPIRFGIGQRDLTPSLAKSDPWYDFPALQRRTETFGFLGSRHKPQRFPGRKT